MRFFFYGTLLEGSANPVAAEIHAKLKPLGMAEAAGVLHAIPDPFGWFPALVQGEGVVRGMVYQAGADFGAADLARMDAYEDYHPADPGASLYLRRTLPVTVDGEAPGTAPGRAEVYLWNRPLPEGSRPIPGGDFRAWLAAGGLAQFTGLREARDP